MEDLNFYFDTLLTLVQFHARQMYLKGNDFLLPTTKFSFIWYCGKLITMHVSHMLENSVNLKCVLSCVFPLLI